VLRLALGVMFIAHGLLKVLVFTPAGTVGYFESLGLPGLFAYVTMTAELGGGLALLLGVASRWVALALIPLLAGTVALVHGANGWLFANPGGGWEYPVFLMAAAVAQALLGDGAYALRGQRRPIPA
ncbi:MAG TPA: LysR family transcriptional regulator, partial [Gammaproteobacteria bacterium]|nr:LysR family transcriptional regulator [Gammaproteobacteria bacterium]